MSAQAPVTFSVLTVCTGNLARSPLAAQLLAARARDIPAVVVTSAGTAAHDGDRMTSQAAALSTLYGGDPSGHTATYLTEAAIDAADLVLTATRAHRAAVVTLLPKAARYTFTLTQFARLVASLDLAEVVDSVTAEHPDDAASNTDLLLGLVAMAASHRGFLPPLENPADDDIEDPFQLPQAVYDRVGAQIDHEVKVIADALVTLSAGDPARGA